MVTNRDRKSFVSRRKFPKLLRRLAPLTFWIRVQAFWDPLREELPHSKSSWIMDPPNSLMWDAQLLSYWFSRNPLVFEDQLVNLINIPRGGLCFGSSRTRRITGGKITTFKLGRPVFDGGIRWCMFPQCFCENSVNFFRRLALQGTTTWQLAPRCCWNRARCQTCFLSASVTRK